MSIFNLNVFKIDFEQKDPVFVQGRSFNSLTFRNSGKISITDENNNTFTSTAPCITFVPKGMSYSTEILKSGEMIVAHFECLEELFENRLKVFDTSNSAAFQKLFSSLLENESKGKFAKLSVFYEILALLSEIDQKKFPAKMIAAKKIIDENFPDSNLCVSSVANLTGVSEAYLRREFKKNFGISPLAYINKKRISTAKAMLKSKFYSVSQISEACGFLSISYFSYAFRKATGFSPTEYAKRFL